MQRQYHILNGDSLREQFPKELTGEIIVTRECLVDGEVQGDNLQDFFKKRAQFIAKDYGAHDYFQKVVPEFQKMQDIPRHSVINLWFEDDLFCQVNFWFVINLLSKIGKDYQYFLVRPQIHNQYGFGGFDESGLYGLYQNKLELTEIETLITLWELYQNNDIKGLLETAQKMEDIYPFLPPAVMALKDSIPSQDNIGKPKMVLLEIIKELETEDFLEVFTEFSKRESIYGFGDSQVKKLFDEIKNKK